MNIEDNGYWESDEIFAVDADEMHQAVVRLFNAAGGYARKVRSLLPADNRNATTLVSPMRIEEVGDICLVMFTQDNGFAAEVVEPDSMFEVALFIASPLIASRFESPGEAAHALGAMMETERDGHKA